MNILYLFILFNFLFIKFSFAEKVTLDDGRTIELNEDGTFRVISDNATVTLDDGRTIELKEDGTFTVISENTNSNFEDSIKANVTKSSNDWSGFYLGVYHSEDKLSASATSNTWPDSPYDVSTDRNKYNLGYFLGYNYSIKDAIVGIETSYQDNVGIDEALPGFDGWAVYDDMVEYKLKVGYSFGKNLAYGFYGSGDLNVYWSDYTNEKTSTHDYEIMGIGLSRKITNNTFIGLSISETDLFLYYPDTDYDEKIQLDSLRLRYGYLF